MKKPYLILLCFIFFLPNAAFAYLDPGSGSILIYGLIGIFTTLIYTLRGFFISLFYGLFSGRKRSFFVAADITLHSESGQYEALFLPLLHELSGKRLKINYLTQYKRPDNAPALPEDINHRVIPADSFGFAKINNVESKIFVTTTPQLNVMMFKRSPRVAHYAYLFHTPTDISLYKPFSFDAFDSLFCVGEFMKENIRILEKERNTKPKRLFDTGVLYYDTLLKNGYKELKKPLKNTILLAPSWGRNGLFSVYGVDFLNLLTAFDVIVRPHPQLKISEPGIYKMMVSKCKKLGFEVDLSTSNRQSLEKAELLISDFSGIIYDFFYLYRKPVMTLSREFDYKALEGRYLRQPFWEETSVKEIGYALNGENIGELGTKIKEIINNPPGDNASFRDRNIYNFGHAAPVAAKQLTEILEEVGHVS